MERGLVKASNHENPLPDEWSKAEGSLIVWQGTKDGYFKLFKILSGLILCQVQYLNPYRPSR